MTQDTQVSGSTQHRQCTCDLREELAALKEAVDGVDRRLSETGQSLGAVADSAERLWEAVETDRAEAARRLHRIDRVEGAFESQWAVLRRLELDLLEQQKQVKLTQQQIAAAAMHA